MSNGKIDHLVICDFDGTIIDCDSVDKIIEEYSINKNWISYEKLWKNEEIDEYICLKNQAESIRINDFDFKYFTSNLKLRHGFIDFVNFCNENGISLIIVSDGFMKIISNVLVINNLDLPVIANDIKFIADYRITFNPKDRLICEKEKLIYLHKDDVVKQIKKNCNKLVYIGDGNSDIKSIGHADIIFARSSLEKYCKKNNIPFFELLIFF